MTILEALQWANVKLKKADIESAMLDAELLLASVFDVPKSWLFGHITDELKPHQEEKFLLLVDRRMKHEPVAYIIGKKDFYGRTFHINSSVLIPRPATETMIDLAKTKFKTCDSEKTLFADIGTGSGAIAVTLAAETHCPILAIDIDRTALITAQQNAKFHNVDEHIDFQHGSLLDPLIQLFQKIRSSDNPNISSVYPFKHLIICANLPYLTIKQMETLDPDVRYEPVRALVSGIDGLNDYWNLFKQLQKNRDILPRYITVFIEIDPDQTENALQLIQHYFPESHPNSEKDLQNNHRVLVTEL